MDQAPQITGFPNPKISLRLVSDLHLFSRRSRADAFLPQIHAAAATADLFVLAGDTFDFKWAHQPTAASFADHAQRWLVDLARQTPSCDFHFLLGNHDHHPALIERLETLSESVPNFAWNPYFFRHRSAIFLHGDVANGFMATTERLERFRLRCGNHRRRPGTVKNRIYDAVIAARLHTLSAGVFFPPRLVAKRISQYLERIGHGHASGTRDVFFGHTHRPLDAFEYRGLRFHNPGAPIKGVRFRILEGEIA